MYMCTHLSEGVYESGQLVVAGVCCHLISSESMLRQGVNVTP